MNPSSLLKMKQNPSALLDKLKGEAEKQTKGGKKDSRFWSPHFNKEKGTGGAVIRFLPPINEDTLPWVQIYYRTFKGNGGQWYFENDLSTLGQKDPAGDMARRLYNSGIESDKEVAKKYKRKVKYISNILVIRDPANPENDGKVFLYEYGSQIFDICKAARAEKDPENVDARDPFEPFNPWTGANLTIRIKAKQIGKDTVPNYDTSSFGEVCAMKDTDDEIVEICSKGYSLTEFIAPEQFKSFDELAKLLFEVVGPTVGSGIETVPGWAAPAAAAAAATRKPQQPAASKQQDDEFDQQDDDLDAIMGGGTTQAAASAAPAATPPADEAGDDLPPPASDDDDLAFMENLMGGGSGN